jgi:hypothetical protein
VISCLSGRRHAQAGHERTDADGIGYGTQEYQHDASEFKLSRAELVRLGVDRSPRRPLSCFSPRLPELSRSSSPPQYWPFASARDVHRTPADGWSAQEAKREARQSKHLVDVRALQKSCAPLPHRAVNDENAPNNAERLSEADLSKVARVLKRHGAPPAPPLSRRRPKSDSNTSSPEAARHLLRVCLTDRTQVGWHLAAELTAPPKLKPSTLRVAPVEPPTPSRAGEANRVRGLLGPVRDSCKKETKRAPKKTAATDVPSGWGANPYVSDDEDSLEDDGEVRWRVIHTIVSHA